MIDNLPQHFEDFARGATGPRALEHGLLTICRTTPDDAWNVLALLDQYHRRGKVSAELCRTLRHKIERQALGIEQFETIYESSAIMSVLADPAAGSIRGTQAAGVAVLADSALCSRGASGEPSRELHASCAQVTTCHEPPRRTQWRRLRASQAIALATVVLGVAASPAVKELPKPVNTAYKPSAAAAAAAAAADQKYSGPKLVSLSSDRYVIFPNKRMAELLVQRTDAAGGNASFVWWTKGSGAKPKEDYIAGRPQLVQMPDGVASVKLLVPILANPSRHHIEMFYVLIGKPGGGASLGPIRRAAVFIMPRN